MSSSSNRASTAASSSINEFEGSDKYGPSFEKMKSFESRLSQIERKAPSILSSFYEPHLCSFSVRPGTVERLSVTSTCYALQTMYATNDSRFLFEDVTNFNVDSSSLLVDGDNDNNNIKAAKKIPVKSILEALILTDWRSEDMFQVPLLLYTILMIDKERQLLHSNDERLSYKVKQLISAVLSARPLRRRGARQYYSDYILFQVALALSHLGLQQNQQQYQPSVTVGNLPLTSLPPDASYELSLSLTRSAENSFNELCRQLAYRASGDRASFDVIRLAYSLLTYITSTTALAGTAGRTEPGNNDNDNNNNNNEPKESAVPPINHRLVASALDAFFSEQNANGLWDKGQPIYESFRKVGRNVGNAFVFSVDTVGSLLDVLPQESFRAHLGSLKRLLEWIEGNEMVEILPDYCDPFSGQCYGKPLQGWSSPHLPPGSGVMAWSTAQTLTCVSRLRKVIARLIHDDVLSEFGGTKQLESGTPNPSSWNRLLDTDLETSSQSSNDSNSQRTLKDVLMTRVLQPFASSSSSASYGAAYSTILFGPPGTAKTTICEAVAEYMGWDFLVIDTSAFLADGLTNVAARIRYVFDRLRALERCVILFDEIEEFCLDRETRGIGMESRMLTTAMLTCINNLRREKKSIFFLATNRLRAFDSAITRPGRFDMQLFVGTPNLEAKCIQFRDKLDLLTVGTNVKEKAITKYRHFLTKHYEDDVMFMNYLEGLQLAQACANIVAKGMDLDDDVMSDIFKPMAAVMTVRGPARDEYIATMELSRL